MIKYTVHSPYSIDQIYSHFQYISLASSAVCTCGENLLHVACCWYWTAQTFCFTVFLLCSSKVTHLMAAKRKWVTVVFVTWQWLFFKLCTAFFETKTYFYIPIRRLFFFLCFCQCCCRETMWYTMQMLKFVNSWHFGMNIFFSLKTNDKHLFDANANIGCLGEVTQCSMSEVISQKPSKIRLNLLLSTNKKDQLSGLAVRIPIRSA